MSKYFMKTDRLGFSVWGKADITNANDLWGDYEVVKLIHATGYMSEDEIRLRLDREIDNQEKFSVQYWPIFLLESGEFVGCCGLRPYKPEEAIYEIGFHMKKAYWGKGYGTEGAKAVIDYAFKSLGLKGLFAGHNPHNNASKYLLTRLRFQYTHDEFYEGTGLEHPSYLLLNKNASSSRK